MDDGGAPSSLDVSINNEAMDTSNQVQGGASSDHNSNNNNNNNDGALSAVDTAEIMASLKQQGRGDTFKLTEASQDLTDVNTKTGVEQAPSMAPPVDPSQSSSVAHEGASTAEQGQAQGKQSADIRDMQITEQNAALHEEAERMDIDHSNNRITGIDANASNNDPTLKMYPIEKSNGNLADKESPQSMELSEQASTFAEASERQKQNNNSDLPEDTANSVAEGEARQASEVQSTKAQSAVPNEGAQNKTDNNDEARAGVLENLPDHADLSKRSKSFEESLERKKRRKRLRRMLKEAGDFPSFCSLISKPLDEPLEGEGGETEETDTDPEVILIDVDDYLGLQDYEESVSPAPAVGRLRSSRYNAYTGNQAADTITSTNNPTSASRAVRTATPAEEGYYEGRVLLSSPDDDKYLTTLQQLIRSNLEYFSATATDAAGSQAGRRYPIVRGKVGIRCIHCAKVGLDHEAAMATKAKVSTNQPDKPTSSEAADPATFNESIKDKIVDPSRVWPPGSISYPLNIAGLYSICSQKPQLHFEQCPNMPPQVKAQFYRLTHESSKAGEAKIKSREVPAAMYYTFSAKQIGLINVPEGLRFGRDLKLDPLPLEAVLAEERQENHEIIVPERSSSAGAAQPDGPTADAASAQVLAEALAEPDVPSKFLARASDKKYVSDFIFLCIRQMALCRAVPADFATRGKKTKNMRVGFAGFCCRHCQRVREEVEGPELARAHGASDFSCRSFSSVADNLGSSITNTFALHLSKCGNTPRRLKAALAAYKRTHQRQMSNLPYGSQRRAFNDIWLRLRAADIPEDEMMERIRKLNPGGPQQAVQQPSTRISTSSASKSNTNSKYSSTKGGNGRSDPDFPVSNDPETLSILKKAEENWDPHSNGGLILPSDREMVSDYVFLTIRNLKVALPTPADIAKGRGQTIMAGMCCIHCEKEDPSLVSPSGRSFPSAPDNYASALNSSLYNHMQNCHFVPAHLRRALKNLRGIHSQQIAQLKFGAQRRYFGLLFDRLRQVPLPDMPAAVVEKARSPPANSRSTSRNGGSRGGSTSRSRVTRRTEKGDDAILGPFGFFEAPCQSYFCLRCRMVPLQFRARGSLSFARPTIDFMTEHKEACKEDGFDLWFVVESLKKVLQTGFKIDYLTNPLFKQVILNCFAGNVDLANIFTNELVKVYQMSRHGGVSKAVESLVKAKSQGLWSSFPRTVEGSKVVQSFEKFAENVKGLSSQLTEHSELVNFLLLISPTLTLPSEDEEDGEDENEEDGNEQADSNDKSEQEGKESGAEEDEENDNNEDGEETREAEEDDDEDDANDEDFVMETSTQSVTPREPKRGKELRRKSKKAPDEAAIDSSRDETQENMENIGNGGDLLYNLPGIL